METCADDRARDKTFNVMVKLIGVVSDNTLMSTNNDCLDLFSFRFLLSFLTLEPTIKVLADIGGNIKESKENLGTFF